ncbi:unnamed protein product, partial [Prorocentrum cordatum]
MVAGQGMFPGAPLVGVLFGSDRARSMMRSWAYLSRHLPGGVYWIQRVCDQRATGLCLAPATTSFKLLCNLLCAVKLIHVGNFHSNNLDGICPIIRASVLRIAPEDHGDPKREDAIFAEHVLGSCHYGADFDVVAACADDSKVHELQLSTKLVR